MFDKLHSIRERMQRILLQKGIIDNDGNILDLPEYLRIIRDEIETEKEEQRMFQNPDGRVENSNIWATIQAEITYLKSLLGHTQNINPLIENPIEIRQRTRPVKQGDQPGMFHRLSRAWYAFQHMVTSRLMR